MGSFTVGDVRLTRVSYFDVPLEPDIVGFTAQEIIALPWATPSWATEDGRVLVGQAIWVIESSGRIVVIDPCGASDGFLRTGPEAVVHQDAVLSAMVAAGFPVETVDIVVMSHLDGIGMVAFVAEGAWRPLFPNARIVISEREIAYITSHPGVDGSAAFRDLMAQGAVDGVEPPFEVVPGVTMELTGGHGPGHAILKVGDGAVFIGHLAINPVEIGRGTTPEPDEAFEALERQLTWASERNALVIGSLWPAPGAGRVSGPPWTLCPA